MDSPVPRIRQGSVLHRLFGVTPGYAPQWVYGLGCGCDGGWIPGAGFVALVITGVTAGATYGWWVLWAVALPLVVIWIHITMRFEDRERFGRARLHRRECVWCGRPDTAPAGDCPACGRRT
jgi:hypothetical protein